MNYIILDIRDYELSYSLFASD